MKLNSHDLAAFFRLDALWESIEGRAFVLVTAAAILVVFWGVFYLSNSYVLSALAACMPPVAYIWWSMRTIGHGRRAPSANRQRK